MALSRACVSRGVVRGPGGGAILLIIIIPAEQAMKNTHDSTSAAAAVARAMVDATRASTEGATERQGGSGVRWTGTRAKFSCQRFRGRAKKNVCGAYDRRKDEHLLCVVCCGGVRCAGCVCVVRCDVWSGGAGGGGRSIGDALVVCGGALLLQKQVSYQDLGRHREKGIFNGRTRIKKPKSGSCAPLPAAHPIASAIQ